VEKNCELELKWRKKRGLSVGLRGELPIDGISSSLIMPSNTGRERQREEKRREQPAKSEKCDKGALSESVWEKVRKKGNAGQLLFKTN